MSRLAEQLGWQPGVQVQHLALTLRADSPIPRPLRLAFAADFHAGPVTHPATVARACAALAELAPDVLLLGGDFISLEARYIDALAEQLGQIPAPYGRYAVLGNHDLWADDYPIIRRLQRAGIEVLINDNVHLAPPFDQLWICGLDDPTAGTPDIERAFAGANGTRIVLMHSPEGLAYLQNSAFTLALCGHTHGGQIAWPSGQPIWLPPGDWNRRYYAGQFPLHGENDSVLVVSRGVGYGALPFRCFAPADIVLCTFETTSALDTIHQMAGAHSPRQMAPRDGSTRPSRPDEAA